jgi:twitching motility protein PilT
VTQQLLATVDGRGRAASAEVLIATPAVRNLIREAKIHQIYSLMQAGGKFGMQTMDASLAQLVRAGKISRESALAQCHDPEELHRILGREAAGAGARPTQSPAAATGSVFMNG